MDNRCSMSNQYLPNSPNLESFSRQVGDYTFSDTFGGIGQTFVKAKVTMNNIIVSQNVMKVYGFKTPEP